MPGILAEQVDASAVVERVRQLPSLSGKKEGGNWSDRYKAALSVLKEDVLKHVTHLMENVPEFPPQHARHFMRHAVETLAYRGSKVLRDAPDGFSSFTCGGGCRSRAHWRSSLMMAKGKREWHDTEPHPWADDVNRFHDAGNSTDRSDPKDALSVPAD